MIVLGIETSCDETAAAVVRDGNGTTAPAILSNIVLSQVEEHRPYGGIVPEIAARAHMENVDVLIKRALDDAKIGFDQLDAVAATGGPGLIGGVIVGVMAAKAIALAKNIPFVAVNHLEGHALTARLSERAADGAADIKFPYLFLLASGGHTQLLSVEGVGRYKRLGTTIDDALGEAFDKTAMLLGLGYPGGPLLERAAQRGDPARFDLPRPLRGKPGCHFSLSGLKAAVRRTIEALPQPLDEQTVFDMAASFQAAVADVVAERTAKGIEIFNDLHPNADTLVVAGGVAANRALRARLEQLATHNGMRLVAPPGELCTDNAAMIAWAGIERLHLDAKPDGMDFRPRPRWPLDPDAPKAVGAGVKA